MMIKSRSALVLGVFFAAVTARTIFDDVWHGAEITVTHIQSAAALVAAIASGHFLWPTLRKGRVPASFGLAIAFMVATAYIVTSAGARNAETADQKQSVIHKANAERDRLRSEIVLAEAHERIAEAEATTAVKAAALECASGEGDRCRGKKATRDYLVTKHTDARQAAMALRGELSLMGPDQVANKGFKTAAMLYEVAGLGRAEVTAARLEILMPFAVVVLSELCALVFLGMAFGHRVSVSKVANDTGPGLPQLPSISTVSIVDFQKHKVLKVLETQRTPISNAKLAELLGETEGEASKSWREVRDRLEIGRQGKELQIKLKRTA